jgi:hypothetical protein
MVLWPDHAYRNGRLPPLSDYPRKLSFDSVVSRIRNTNTRFFFRFQGES